MARLDGMFNAGFDATKLKQQLKMAGGRIKIASSKKSALLKQNKREVAVFLAEDPPKEEKARICAEALIRDENLIEAYELLQANCNVLHERINLIQDSGKTCPHDLTRVISTLIWASQRVDIPELIIIRKQFSAKYGKVFEENAIQNYHKCLNESVVSKLTVKPPAAHLVQTYLKGICEELHVDWTPAATKPSADPNVKAAAVPTGYDSVAVSQVTGYGRSAIMPAYTKHGKESRNVIHPAAPNAPPSMIVTKSAGIRTGESYFASTGSSAPSALGGNSTLFDEPDIFVPASIAPAPGASNVSQSSKSDDDDNDDGDDDDDRNGVGASAAQGVDDFQEDQSVTYANLAARFDQLKK